MTTNTRTMELQPIEPQAAHLSSKKSSTDQLPLQDSLAEGQRLSETQAQDPENAVEALARWNKPKKNIYRLATIFLAFIFFGMNNASYGPVLPYVHAPFLFLPFNQEPTADRLAPTSRSRKTTPSPTPSPPWSSSLPFSATSSPHSSPIVYTCASANAAWPPLPLTKLLAYGRHLSPPALPGGGHHPCLCRLRHGLLDGAWNAWVGTMYDANQILGLMHGCYGAGATIAPTIATSMVTKYRLGWWQFYYVMAGLMVLETGWSDGRFGPRRERSTRRRVGAMGRRWG